MSDFFLLGSSITSDLVQGIAGRLEQLPATMQETGALEVRITHGRKEALAHAAAGLGIRAKALALVGYEEEEGS
mgnify:FL=1